MLKKLYRNHFGLDLKSNDIDRPEQYASDLLNAQYKKDGSLEKRKGFKAVAESAGGKGLFKYNKVNSTTAAVQPELLTIDSTLKKFTNGTFVVTYSGSNTLCLLSFFFDETTSTYKVQIVEGTTLVLDFDCGIGFDEASVIDIADLKTAIDAVTNFSATITGNTTVPAAFLSIVLDYDLTGGAYTFTTNYWSSVNTPVANPFSSVDMSDDQFELITAAQLNNVIYFASGSTELMKYDGQNLYRASLPQPSAVAGLASAGAGSVPDGTYQYAYLYKQIDAQGNEIFGDITTNAEFVVSGGHKNINVTVNNIQSSTGFNTNCAIVNGVQSGITTITVDSGHTLKVGDTAYFFDGASSAYVTRSVTAVTTTTITISGANVNVADNLVISNNLRIVIYRSEDAGTFLFELAEIPNDSFNATQVYLDSALDSALGAQYIEPLNFPGLPPKCKYVTTYYNQLMLAGNITDPNTFYWSDVDNLESFPVINSAIAQSRNGEPISGIHQNNEILVVFEPNATHVYSGDFITNVIRAEIISHDVGCVSHNTIQQVDNMLYFLNDQGIHSMVSGQIPNERSFRIQPLFIQNNSTIPTQVYKYKRAVGFADLKSEKYIVLIPTETTNGSDVYVNDDYLMVVEDYGQNSQDTVYFKWKYENTNIGSGMVEYSGDIYFSERAFSSFAGSSRHVLFKLHDMDTIYDYIDHSEPIDWSYSTAWYALGEPSVFKKFNRLKLFFVPESGGNIVTLGIKTEKDYIKELTRNDISLELSGAGLGYGNNEYGDFPYGDVPNPTVVTKLNGKYKAMRIIFSNAEVHRNVEFSSWELEIQAPFRDDLKK